MFRQHRPNIPGRLDAVHIRHFPIQKYKVKCGPLLMRLSDLADSPVAAQGILDGHPGAFHGTDYIDTDGLIIIYNQYAGDSVFFPKSLIHLLVLDAKLKFNGKDTSLTPLTLHINPSAHQLHQIFYNGHSKAGSLDLICHAIDFTGKGFKNHC